MPNNTTPDPMTAAVAALQKIKSTYVHRHAYVIAELALDAKDDEAAIRAVRLAIGHTSVGSRRYTELALLARKAAQAAVPMCLVCKTRPQSQIGCYGLTCSEDDCNAAMVRAPRSYLGAERYTAIVEAEARALRTTHEYNDEGYCTTHGVIAGGCIDGTEARK